MSSNADPTLWSRVSEAITWALKSALRLVLLLLLLAIVSSGVWLGLQEVDRSLNNIVRRIAIAEENLALLRSDTNTLMETNLQRRQDLSVLQSEAHDSTRRLSDLENRLVADLALQRERLDSLDGVMAELLTASENQREELSGVGAALVSLQVDVNDHSGRIDHLGGEFDDLHAGVALLDTGMATFRAEFDTPDNEVRRLREAIALFRIWELVARARLRLLESNPGLASADTALALAALHDLRETTAALTSDSLLPVQNRLTLALDSLPSDPTAAGRDLESAWEELDRLLGDLLSPPTAVEEAAVTP